MSNYNAAVMHFTKCSPGTTLASAGIARYIAKELGIMLIDDQASCRRALAQPCKNILLVNSPFAFCKFRDIALRLIGRGNRLIWVQNDYAIKRPSQVRKPDITWTTIPDEGQYINWNQLTWCPKLRQDGGHQEPGLFYYGAFRAGREGAFERYLCTDKYPVHVSCSAAAGKHYRAMSQKVIIYKPFSTLGQLTRFQTTVYIQDKKSGEQYHSLANRFYECLSAQLAILIDAESLGTFVAAGLAGAEKYVVECAGDVSKRLADHGGIRAEQRALWGSVDYLGQLSNRLHGLGKEYLT